MAFFVGVCHVVVGFCWHHCRDMEDEFHTAVAPAICELAIIVFARVQTARVEFCTFQTAERAKIAEKRGVCWGPDVVHEDVSFVCLTFANVYDAYFVVVNRGDPVKRGDGASGWLIVRQRDWWIAEVKRRVK